MIGLIEFARTKGAKDKKPRKRRSSSYFKQLRLAGREDARKGKGKEKTRAGIKLTIDSAINTLRATGAYTRGRADVALEKIPVEKSIIGVGTLGSIGLGAKALRANYSIQSLNPKNDPTKHIKKKLDRLYKAEENIIKVYDERLKNLNLIIDTNINELSPLDPRRVFHKKIEANAEARFEKVAKKRSAIRSAIDRGNEKVYKVASMREKLALNLPNLKKQRRLSALGAGLVASATTAYALRNPIKNKINQIKNKAK